MSLHRPILELIEDFHRHNQILHLLQKERHYFHSLSLKAIILKSPHTVVIITERNYLKLKRFLKSGLRRTTNTIRSTDA
jgi:hypothetical protein